MSDARYWDATKGYAVIGDLFYAAIKSLLP